VNESVRVEFCGEWFDVAAPNEFVVGREGNLVIDDNPYLHRRFLVLTEDHGLWWIVNEGSLLSATLTDASGGVQAWLPPGARLPIVFSHMQVLFTAGSTTYDFTIHAAADMYATTSLFGGQSGATTIGVVPLTSSQRLVILVLAENVIRQDSPGRGTIPSSTDAAQRLGWPLTTFNRKLDNVCEKLDKVGVQGLRGGRGKLATGRRQRLVEYAVASKLVSRDDLSILAQRVASASEKSGELSP